MKLQMRQIMNFSQLNIVNGALRKPLTGAMNTPGMDGSEKQVLTQSQLARDLPMM
jgi:hypothetical protein